MASIEQGIPHDEIVKSARYVTAGSLAEAMTGVGTVTVAILALANVLPLAFAAIGTIAVGAGLLFEGAAIAGRFDDLLTEAQRADLAHRFLGRGMAAESVGGVAGVVLGILALLSVDPLVLLPVAMIGFGAAFLFGTGASHDLNQFVLGDRASEERRRLTREAVTVANGGQVLLGLGALTLGILGVLSIAPLTLTLVGLLAVGAAAMLAGTALSVRWRLNL